MSEVKSQLLEVNDLKVHFPVTRGGIFKREKRVVHAVDGITLTLNPGETLGLVGESGCGKSTTGRAICQLLRTTAGQILIEGLDLRPLSWNQVKPHRKNFQMVFQNPFSSLDPRMTIGSVLEEPLKHLMPLTKAQRKERIMQLLQEVNLNAKFVNRYPHEFSGGQRQRINIARALAVNPKLIVLDEPVSALDVSIQAQIINLLQDLQQKYHMAYLFIAHDLSVVKTISHRVAVMYLGKIVEIGETNELYNQPKHPYTMALMSAVPIPDPLKERKRKRIPLKGEIPSPIDLPKGCTFHPRCPFVQDRCRVEAPVLRKLSNGTSAACHFAENLVPAAVA